MIKFEFSKEDLEKDDFTVQLKFLFKYKDYKGMSLQEIQDSFREKAKEAHDLKFPPFIYHLKAWLDQKQAMEEK